MKELTGIIYDQGRCGDFPLTLQTASILAASKSQGCLPSSTSVSRFLLVCAVFTAVVLLKELVPERGDDSLGLGTWLLQRQIAISLSVNFPTAGRPNRAMHRTGAHRSHAVLEFPVWKGVSVQALWLKIVEC